jgi:hypothetical protein
MTYILYRVIFYFKFISDPEMPGSGMIFPDPDPAKSFGSARIHNTALSSSAMRVEKNKYQQWKN